MSNSSNLNGPSPIYPISAGVWKIRKNQRTDDRKKQDHDREYEESGERENKDTIDIKEPAGENVSASPETGQEQSEPTADDEQRRNPYKVDLII